MQEEIFELQQRLRAIEERLYNEIKYDMKSIAQSEVKKKWKIPAQSETQFGLFTALVVDTIDPWKQNRIRFFSPLFHNPNTSIKSLPFANSISSMGGFDACGLTWVPPAGSTVCILFENGHRDSAYYIGTTWHRNRGPDGNHNWSYPIEEYYSIHEGHRKNYLVGRNDGSQVLPPWNTENYNGYDIDTLADFENDPEAKRKITYPNIYGFITPQKHSFKMVDGNYKCNHKHKRLEILSGCGNWLILKDDHLHNGGTWAHPSCGGSGPDTTDCEDVETVDCTPNLQGGPSSTPQGTSPGLDSNKGSNPYFKYSNECRPYKGPGTPQNNKCELPQSGIQMLSISGHTCVMDDSVESPSGIPNWERGTKSFDFGCTDKFLGKMFWKSATGHLIEISDVEDDTNVRGDKNYVKILTASGNRLELNDHTVNGLAGEKRGITLQSSSNHTLEMLDEENDQKSPDRKSGGVPVPKAKKAFVRLRSGYGMEILLKDDDSQQETKQQYLQIFCPQKDNTDRGPHILRMQENPSGPGLVFLRVGGNYVCSTYDNHYTIVGDPEENPANKITAVSENTLIDTKKFYLNAADVHYFNAKQIIILGAGQDCPIPETDELGPCIVPLLCLKNGIISTSDRVFVSAKECNPCSIFQLAPFAKCPEEDE